MAGEEGNLSWLTANTTRWIGENGLLSGILDALEASPETTPLRFGPDERHLAAYSRKAALAKKPKRRGGEWFQMFVRGSAPLCDGTISCDEGTDVQLRFQGKALKGGWKFVFDLGDELARRMNPRLMAVAVATERRNPKQNRAAEIINLIVASGHMYEPKLTTQGLIGLAPRTYLGREVVDLIGRDRIESLALPREWFEGGGVRIDLVPEPWNAAPEDLVKPWREAMEILRPSEVFSTIKGTTEHGTVIARRGARWV